MSYLKDTLGVFLTINSTFCLVLVLDFGLTSHMPGLARITNSVSRSILSEPATSSDLLEGLSAPRLTPDTKQVNSAIVLSTSKGYFRKRGRLGKKDDIVLCYTSEELMCPMWLCWLLLPSVDFKSFAVSAYNSFVVTHVREY